MNEVRESGPVKMPTRFTYRSTKGDCQRWIPDDLLEEIRAFLQEEGFGMHWTMGETQAALLNFTDSTGSKLLINQMEPIFLFLCRSGKLWSKYIE